MKKKNFLFIIGRKRTLKGRSRCLNRVRFLLKLYHFSMTNYASVANQLCFDPCVPKNKRVLLRIRKLEWREFATLHLSD